MSNPTEATRQRVAGELIRNVRLNGELYDVIIDRVVPQPPTTPGLYKWSADSNIAVDGLLWLSRGAWSIVKPLRGGLDHIFDDMGRQVSEEDLRPRVDSLVLIFATGLDS